MAYEPVVDACERAPLDLAAPLTPVVPVTDLGRLRLLSRVAEQVGEGVAVFDNDDLLIYANPALAQIHECAPEDLIGRHVSVFVDEDAYVATPEVLEGGDAVLRVEVNSRHLDGSPQVAQVTVSLLRDDAGERLGSIVCIQDITVRKALEAQLERAAFFDPLTDLANRRLLLEQMERALQAGGAVGSTAVLFIDLDGFKQVNDVHGHDIGDQLLVRAAARLQGCARDTDTLARLGGDEFVLLVEHVDLEDAEAIAARMVASLSEPFDLEQARVTISVSIGIALGNSGTCRDLLHAADVAMYEAKRRGPGHVLSSKVAPPAPGLLATTPAMEDAVRPAPGGLPPR